MTDREALERVVSGDAFILPVCIDVADPHQAELLARMAFGRAHLNGQDPEAAALKVNNDHWIALCKRHNIPEHVLKFRKP